MSDKILYEMLVSDENVDGVYAISLVDSPAILTDYVLLSKDENKIDIEIKLEKLVDQKRKVVCGPALIPNMIIPRQNYDIMFSENTIRKISENFLINGNKDNVTLQHKVSVNKVNLVESWIVDDPANDKSTMLGYDLPKGTWMVSFKINSDELWSEYLDSGILKGFSIEGNFSQQEVKLEHNHDYEYDIMSDEDRAIYDLYLQLNFPAGSEEDFYVWKLGDKEHCPSCLKNSNKIKKLKDWAKEAIPQLKTGDAVGLTTLTFVSPYVRNANTRRPGEPPFGTYCEEDCGCELKPIKKPSVNKTPSSWVGPFPKSK